MNTVAIATDSHSPIFCLAHFTASVFGTKGKHFSASMTLYFLPLSDTFMAYHSGIFSIK